jgi:hypothetical protein
VILRFTATVGGRKVRRELGLGAAHGPTGSFEDAQIAAIEAAKLIKAGGPVADKEAKRQMDRAAEKQAAPEIVTFWDACEAYIEGRPKRAVNSPCATTPSRTSSRSARSPPPTG